MSGETENQVSAWTIDSLKEHQVRLDVMQAALDAERDRRYTEIAEERDRRLSEVAVEREKALKIKETADLAALQLAREIQTYKDEKANELRSQIERERGTYATKGDLTAAMDRFATELRPISEFVQRQQASSETRSDLSTTRRSDTAVNVAMIVAAVAIASLVLTLVLALR